MTKDQLPQLKDPLPMPTVKAPNGASKIEQTRHDLYGALAKIRKAKKHPKATDALETALEEHLEELQRFEYPDLKRRLAEMTKERDDCQERMRAVDEAYRKSQEALVIAGDELRRVQAVAKDCLDAEKLADDLGEKLGAATAVIGQQEQLIAGQRKAIADMHNELVHRRVIGKAFMQARLAFVALDEALHEAPQSKAVRAFGDDIADAEVTF